MEEWIGFYETGLRLVSAKMDLDRKRIEFQQLAGDHVVNAKKLESDVAKIEADIEEHRLRQANAVHQRRSIGASADPNHLLPGPDPDERQLEVARHRRKLDSRWDIYEDLGSKLTTLMELQHWRKQQRAGILRDQALSPQEQEENLDFLDSLYDQKRSQLKIDTKIFEEE